jgi:hypothetical protein
MDSAGSEEPETRNPNANISTLAHYSVNHMAPVNCRTSSMGSALELVVLTLVHVFFFSPALSKLLSDGVHTIIVQLDTDKCVLPLGNSRCRPEAI